MYTYTSSNYTCAVCVATLKYPRDKVSFIITVVPETHRADGPGGRRGVITQGDSHVRTEVNRVCTVVIKQGLLQFSKAKGSLNRKVPLSCCTCVRVHTFSADV